MECTKIEYTEADPTGQDLLARRAERVCWFVIILGLLNLFDLQMTLKAMDNGVMFEANPIAELIMAEHGRAGISVFKTFSIGSALIFFVIGRRSKLSELGCVMGIFLYVGIGIMWALYPWKVLLALG